MLLPVFCFSYNYGSLAVLPDGVKKLLPENPDILASASADLNGDKQNDYAVIIQYKDPADDNDALMKAKEKEGRRFRELLIIIAADKGFTVASRSTRAVLCSECGAPDNDPFLNIKAVAKSFTILHKFEDRYGEPWGIAAKFGYSKRDNKWQLTYFSGAENTELKPENFGLINLEDFDIAHYMSNKKIESWPAAGIKTEMFPDDILYTVDGAAYVIRPDGTNIRYITGDRFYRKVGHPNWSADRKQIAFIRNNDMYVTGADGRGEKLLFKDVIKIFRYDYEKDGTIYDMKWSPDGKYFAITGLRSNSDYNHSCFYIRSADGVTKTVKELGKNDSIGSLCWAPDSSRLAYYRSGTLTVLDLNSGNEKPLLAGAGKSGIAWSQDGNRLLTLVKGGYGIVDAGNGSIRVLKCEAWSGYGSIFWSKDEKYGLSYTSDYIFIAPVEEGGKSRIVIGGDNGLVDGLSW